MAPDRRARQLAARHDGVISYRDLLRCGFSRKQIRGRVAGGDLIRLHHHVFLVAGAALTFRARVRAALLALGPTAFASHLTAAVLWGIRRGEPEVIDITVIGGGERRLTGVRVHRLTHPPTGEIRTRDGIRVSAPARAICEMAGSEARDTVEYAVQEAAAKLRLTPAELSSAATRWGCRPGASMLRTILQSESSTGISRSWAQRRLRRIVRAAGLPLPSDEVVIDGHPRDHVWSDQRVIVEIDGIGTHGTPVAFLEDRRQSNRLTLAGWTVLRFAATQPRDEPMVVVAQIAQALTKAG